MRARLVLPLLLLPSAVAWGSHTAAERLGAWAGDRLARAATFAPLDKLATVLFGDAPGDDLTEHTADVVDLMDPTPENLAAVSRIEAKQKAPPKRAIRVSAAKVLALAHQGIRPTGTAVAATAAHPAGLVLHGVGGLGTGVLDGDILTHVGGQPVRSSAAVAAAAFAAWQAKARSMSGTLWRRGETIGLLVEIPEATPAPAP